MGLKTGQSTIIIVLFGTCICAHSSGPYLANLAWRGKSRLHYVAMQRPEGARNVPAKLTKETIFNLYMCLSAIDRRTMHVYM